MKAEVAFLVSPAHLYVEQGYSEMYYNALIWYALKSFSNSTHRL